MTTLAHNDRRALSADGQVTGSRNYFRLWRFEIFSRRGREKGVHQRPASLAVDGRARDTAEQRTWQET